MEQIGVEALVEGLSAFKSNMEEVKGKIEGLADSQTILDRAFSAIGDVINSFTESVVHVAEYAIGGLLRDAIRGAIDLLVELGQAAVDSAGNLQTLEIRLQGINLTDAKNQTADFTAAQQMATQATQEQLDWLRQLSSQTVYDPDQIANVYFLARSYQFTDEQARGLTESITNFAAGMGLGDEQIRRIIINLGQMQQQGKVTQRDLNDLARGAFVPVNTILQEMTRNLQANGRAQELLGEPINKLKEELIGYQNQLAIALQRQSEFTDNTSQSVRMANSLKIDELRQNIADTTSALDSMSAAANGTGTLTADMFDKMKKAGLPVEEFMKAFEQFVGENFANSNRAMTMTLAGAIERAKNFAKTILGWDVLKPVFDVLGMHLGEFLDKLMNPDNLERIRMAGNDIARVFGKILEAIFELTPSADVLVNSIVQGISNLAKWLEDHKDVIISVVTDIASKIGEVAGLIAQFVDMLFGKTDEKGTTRWERLAGALWNVVSAILRLFGLDMTKGPDWEKIGDAIDWLTQKLNEFAAWIDENSETIKLVLEIFLGFLIIQEIVKFVASLVIGFIGLALSIVGAIGALKILGPIIAVVVGIILSFIANIMIFKFFWELWQSIIETGARAIATVINDLVKNLKDNIDVINYYIKNGDWLNAGRAIVLTLIEGVYTVMESLANIGKTIAESIYDNLDKEIYKFYNWGANIIYGIINGIGDNKSKVGDALVEVAQAAWNRFTEFWQMRSPSRLAIEGGENIMQGLTNGIIDGIGQAQDAMTKAAADIAMPMLALPQVAQTITASAPASVNSTVQNTNNFNLAINSSASTEPVIQDFALLQSLAGGA